MDSSISLAPQRIPDRDVPLHHLIERIAMQKGNEFPDQSLKCTLWNVCAMAERARIASMGRFVGEGQIKTIANWWTIS